MEKLNEGNSRTRKGRPLSSGSKEWKEAAEFELGFIFKETCCYFRRETRGYVMTI